MSAFYTNGSVLMHRGVPVREFGLNCPDFLIRWLSNTNSSLVPTSGNPITYQTNVAANCDLMLSYGFRVVRFAAFGNRPLLFQKSWIEAKAGYLAAFDAMIAICEAKGMLLIPSLHFDPAQIAPVYGEGLSAIASSTSQTRLAMLDVQTSLVNRYKNSPAIAMWQFGNEYDGTIGNAGQYASSQAPDPTNGFSINTDLGTPAAWVYPNDSGTIETVHNAMTAFQQNVKALDNSPAWSGTTASRATTSGNQGYRNRIVTQKFSRWMQDMLDDEKTDVACIHTYATFNNGQYYNSDFLGYEYFLRNVKDTCAAAGKPVIVGEFGIPQDYSVGRLPAQQQERVASAIMSAGIQLALLWDFPALTGTDYATIGGVSRSKTSFRPDEPTGNRGAELQFLSALNSIYKST
jgi:hypothetical protein